VTRPRSLRARLLAAIGVVAVLSVALAFAIGAALTKRQVERSTLREISAQADLLAERERASLLPLSRLGTLEPFLERQGQRVVVEPLDGTSAYLPADRVSALRHGRPVDGTITVEDERYFYAARLVSNRAFVLLRPTSLAESAWRPHVEGLLVGALAAAILAALAAFLLARAVSGPIARVAAATTSVAEARSPPSVPVEGPSELAALAESFNEMASRLARAQAAERAFLLSVSHELKTPLTAIRGYAEGLAEGMLPAEDAADTIRLESARLERLVHDLLDLARMNKSEFTVRREPVDLTQTAYDVVRRYELTARTFGVALEVVPDGTAPALADGDRVVQVVSNLVENALRLTPSGGAVRVTTGPGRITVEDTGPGIRADDLPQAFERFYLHSRYGRERPVGTGLGLAIVKQLAEGMGGSVEAESEPDVVTRFTVRLPVDAEAVGAGERTLANA
jgi:two-component system, OmpR family, sensor kinase